VVDNEEYILFPTNTVTDAKEKAREAVSEKQDEISRLRARLSPLEREFRERDLRLENELVSLRLRLADLDRSSQTAKKMHVEEKEQLTRAQDQLVAALRKDYSAKAMQLERDISDQIRKKNEALRAGKESQSNEATKIGLVRRQFEQRIINLQQVLSEELEKTGKARGELYAVTKARREESASLANQILAIERDIAERSKVQEQKRQHDLEVEKTYRLEKKRLFEASAEIKENIAAQQTSLLQQGARERERLQRLLAQYATEVTLLGKTFAEATKTSMTDKANREAELNALQRKLDVVKTVVESQTRKNLEVAEQMQQVQKENEMLLALGLS